MIIIFIVELDLVLWYIFKHNIQIYCRLYKD